MPAETVGPGAPAYLAFMRTLSKKLDQSVGAAQLDFRLKHWASGRRHGVGIDEVGVVRGILAHGRTLASWFARYREHYNTRAKANWTTPATPAERSEADTPEAADEFANPTRRFPAYAILCGDALGAAWCAPFGTGNLVA
jgi:hypothetical protein